MNVLEMLSVGQIVQIVFGSAAMPSYMLIFGGQLIVKLWQEMYYLGVGMAFGCKHNETNLSLSYGGFFKYNNCMACFDILKMNQSNWYYYATAHNDLKLIQCALES